MSISFGNEEITRIIDLLAYLHRHIAALEKLHGHTAEIEACHRTIQTLLDKFPHLRAIKDLFIKS